MHTVILPERVRALLTAFARCCHAPSSQNCVTRLAGWVHGRGRRTVTAVVRAAAAAGGRHSALSQRFVARAPWLLDDRGRVLCGRALAWRPSDQPLVVIVAATLCRKGGKGIGGATLQHDRLRSTRPKPCCRFGQVWVVLARWVVLALGEGRWGRAAPSRCPSGFAAIGAANAVARPLDRRGARARCGCGPPRPRTPPTRALRNSHWRRR